MSLCYFNIFLTHFSPSATGVVSGSTVPCFVHPAPRSHTVFTALRIYSGGDHLKLTVVWQPARLPPINSLNVLRNNGSRSAKVNERTSRELPVQISGSERYQSHTVQVARTWVKLFSMFSLIFLACEFCYWCCISSDDPLLSDWGQIVTVFTQVYRTVRTIQAWQRQSQETVKKAITGISLAEIKSGRWKLSWCSKQIRGKP